MVSHADQEIETLKTIADSYPREWLERRNIHKCTHATPHDAGFIFSLVMTNSHAVVEPESKKVSHFISKCTEFNTYDLEAVGHSKIERMLLECFWRLDELFFFGLFVRKLHDPVTNLPSHLVTLNCVKSPAKECNGLFLWGRFKAEGTITIWPSGANGPRKFAFLLVTLIHEMIHAWFGIFSDNSHPHHEEWVAKDGKHGELFKGMLKFCLEYIIDKSPPDSCFARDMYSRLVAQEFWTIDNNLWKRFN
ncbi:hypothetical protein GGR55DRAFT_629604 [Xylaria sp. FL0064]|nr:hypothetical protein GGR55DRAFT_629604 [Xylaria sp. FL0064]